MNMRRNEHTHFIFLSSVFVISAGRIKIHSGSFRTIASRDWIVMIGAQTFPPPYELTFDLCVKVRMIKTGTNSFSAASREATFSILLFHV